MQGNNIKTYFMSLEVKQYISCCQERVKSTKRGNYEVAKVVHLYNIWDMRFTPKIYVFLFKFDKKKAFFKN